MSQPSSNEHASIVPATPDAQSARKPFVRPTVQDAGGLQNITLIGGSL